MNIEQFWQLIEATKEESSGNTDIQADLLTRRLRRFSVPNIIRFDRIFGDHYAPLHSSVIWAAAELIKGGCSDDSYDYFRAWLIGQGKAIYDIALANPDDLAEVESIVGAKTYSGELLMYAAGYAYEEKTGEDDFDEQLLDEELTDQPETGSYEWLVLDWVQEGKTVPEKLKEMLPKLYHRFRES
jgi:hypothetical protein